MLNQQDLLLFSLRYFQTGTHDDALVNVRDVSNELFFLSLSLFCLFG